MSSIPVYGDVKYLLKVLFKSSTKWTAITLSLLITF
uniref:Uncharacterized protein n=1 Tax=Anguilla anguilla TaxID=7936 RepID=A0A0E9QKN6_ANGAN